MNEVEFFIQLVVKKDPNPRLSGRKWLVRADKLLQAYPDSPTGPVVKVRLLMSDDVAVPTLTVPVGLDVSQIISDIENS